MLKRKYFRKNMTGIITAVFVLGVSPYSSFDLRLSDAEAVNDGKKQISTISITTEDMIEPVCEYVNHPEGCWGRSIKNNEYVSCRVEYTDPNGSSSVIADESAKIKIRGNTSAYSSKKPYKLKLSKKQSFNTEESSKKWILISDGRSLNYLFSNWTAEYCGVEWQPEFEYVNVTVNGDYKGCYILTEDVGQITKHLNFDDEGFLVENDAYWWNSDDNYFKADKQDTHLGFTFKEPDAEDMTGQQISAIADKVCDAVNSITAGDESEYLDHIDAEAFASWFLAKDYMCSSDAAGSNMYWYSEGADTLLKLGPVSDYNNDYMSDIDSWPSVHTNYNFGSYLFSKESFKKIYREQYEKTKNIYNDLNAYISGFFETYGESLQESWNADAVRWNAKAGSVEEKKDALLDWYLQRSAWIDSATAGWSPDSSQNDALQNVPDKETYNTDPIQEETDDITQTVTKGTDSPFLMTGSALSAESDAESVPSFRSSSLVLSGQIGVNFYLDLSSLTEQERNEGYMEFRINGRNSTDSFDMNSMSTSGNNYGFTCYVSPVEMADTITAVYHYGSGNTIKKTYSVLEYIEHIEENADNFDDATLDLVRAIADYGHYAQLWLSVNNNWTVGKEHKAMEKHYTDSYSYDSIRDNAESYKRDLYLGTSGVEKITYSLSLNAVAELNVFIKPEDKYEGDVSITVTGEDGNPAVCNASKQQDGRYLISISDIPADRLGDTYIINANASNGTASCDLSALSYVFAVLDSEAFDDTAKNAVSSLYTYYDAVVRYCAK